MSPPSVEASAMFWDFLPPRVGARHPAIPDVRTLSFEGPWMLCVRRHIAAVAVTATVATGCSASSPEPDGGPEALTAETCSLAAAAVDEPQAAADGFATEVHGPLHDLVDEVLQEDRAAAGRVMQAKADVEAEARQDSPDGNALQEALRNLAEQIPGSSGCGDR